MNSLRAPVYYPAETRIAPLTTIRQQRLLPKRGRVLVRPGDWVEPGDVVARCQIPGKLCVVDVSQALGIPRELVRDSLRKQIGAAVQADDVLAERNGTLGRSPSRCVSPEDGRVIAIRLGRVLIETPPRPFELDAMFRGRVADVLPQQGVLISTVGARIQGVWGSGGDAYGVLTLPTQGGQEPLDEQILGDSTHRALVVIDDVLSESILGQAVDLGVGGLIAGSANHGLCRQTQPLPVSVLLTEGFGQVPMSRRAFSILQSCAGREAMLSIGTLGTRGAPGMHPRPEVLVPLESRGTSVDQEIGPRPLRGGEQVRCLRAPYLGLTGTVTKLPVLPQKVESGARLPVARVELTGDTSVVIAVANLEVIR
jgi:hypothetical protein